MLESLGKTWRGLEKLEKLEDIGGDRSGRVRFGVVLKVISDVASKFSNYADTVSMKNRFCYGQ